MNTKFPFNEGDRVRVKDGATPTEGFTGEAIFHGVSHKNDDWVALELLDKQHNRRTGSSQHGWWSFLQDELDQLELVVPVVKEKLTEADKKINWQTITSKPKS
jgi:hypothetical protein